jgi:peroxiredoxin
MVLLESGKIESGLSAPDFSLLSTQGGEYCLNDFKDFNVLVVVFMCNHCPYVQAVWGRLVSLQSRFFDKGVRFVGINSNNNPDYPEETLEKMGEYYDRYKMNFPYLFDETQKVARSYGAVCTPDIFVYDKNRKLVYRGRIDDNWQDSSAVTKEELACALDKIIVGEDVSENQNPSMGCSIKWVN